MTAGPGTYGVVVITRDRPEYVRGLLPSLAAEARRGSRSLGIALVDDSREVASRAENAATCREVAAILPCVHLTLPDQQRLLARFPPEDARLFARPLGDPSWNVGSSRNTGSLFWLAEVAARPDVIVFLDDDLETAPGHEGWLAHLAAASHEGRALAGAPLIGMPDEARTYRIRRSALKNLGQAVPDEVRWTAYPISGGCMALPATLAVQHPFGQIYNEDYFLFYELESVGTPVVVLPREASVLHRVTPDPITLAKLQQEAIGEITDRALTSAPRHERTLDWLAAHWDRWRQMREAHADDIRELVALCTRSPAALDQIHVPVLAALLGWLADLEIDRRPVQEHARARATWAARLATPLTPG